MKTIYRLLMSLVLAGALVSCDTQQDVWNTGTSSPYHDCTVMEYLRGDSYNWELTVELIERAGLTDLFEGQVDTLPEITFWGFPSYSVKRYLLDNGLKSVDEIELAVSRELVLKHVVKGKVLKKDIAFRDKDYYIFDREQTGGTELKGLVGNLLKAYIDKTQYSGVPETGAEVLYLYSFSAETMVPLACPDIQPNNGVVHSLNYNYVLGKI